MKKSDLQKELKKGMKLLKNHSRFIDLLSDGPKGDLTRLNQTLKRIEMLLNMNKLKEVAHPTNKALQPYTFGFDSSKGILVSVRPVGEEYGKKTHIGFLLGEIATGSAISITDKKIQLQFSGHNPAIFVPELGKVIYGYESWWTQIKSEADLKDITDKDIANVWYVKAIRALNEKQTKEKL